VGWVDLKVGLNWVGNGSEIFVFSVLGLVMGLTWYICEKHKSCIIHATVYRVSTDKFVLRKRAVSRIVLTAGRQLFDICGFGRVLVG